MNLNELMLEVAGESGSGLERVMRVVEWMNAEFAWTGTDYQERTVAQIIERRAGNCKEHAKVLYAFVQALGVPVRWVAEINIQPPSESRQASAEAMVRRGGPAASVFGLMHNDHRWLEVYDAEQGAWFPIDSTLNLFGMEAWIEGRLGFGARPAAGQELLVPFVVVGFEPGLGITDDDRSAHYLIDSLGRHFGPRLTGRPAWPAWQSQVMELSGLARSAFRGQVNLHEHLPKMEALLSTYEKLRS